MGDVCPVPLVKAKNAIAELAGSGKVEVLVDNEIAVQNLEKMAQQKGYGFLVKEKKEKEYLLVDGYNIILKKPINIGIAVSLNDGNLIVPVIHDADKLNLSGLASQIDTLAAKARENKLAPDSIQGGTFTITNFGTFKSLFGTPIINQPQVAILAVGYIEKKPAVVETPEGDTIAIRHKMYLSLSYDHRIVDGALAGAFLRSIADELENWNA